ncbi:hypothetical protein QE361_000958 [Sphingomonas sp. SORGH_AS802]|uniref:hypothetical protein n=1 Tax=unclassified Sphingomonas TaxID=196159 RepID=UPI002865FA9F|nr:MULTISPECIES: hypothetical protein [unclassified Sphingomonas]MDR6125365.1 hypothetical protein [Sphingomonas sp. SORGH_AS_0438]MDR6133983.1 hypothetical protein [Sphingomonas sp. SORGH_AS_0802]
MTLKTVMASAAKPSRGRAHDAPYGFAALATTACAVPEPQEKIYAYSLNFNDDFFAPRDRRGVIHPKMEGQDA